MTVRAEGDGVVGGPRPDSVEMIVIDTSGSMQEEGGRKMQAAKTATQAAIDTIDDGVYFAIVGGNAGAYMIYPRDGLAISNPQTRQEAKHDGGPDQGKRREPPSGPG